MLGQGANGTTYRAQDDAGRTVTGKESTLKASDPDKLRELVDREATVLRQLAHDGVPARLRSLDEPPVPATAPSPKPTLAPSPHAEPEPPRLKVAEPHEAPQPEAFHQPPVPHRSRAQPAASAVAGVTGLAAVPGVGSLLIGGGAVLLLVLSLLTVIGFSTDPDPVGPVVVSPGSPATVALQVLSGEPVHTTVGVTYKFRRD